MFYVRSRINDPGGTPYETRSMRYPNMQLAEAAAMDRIRRYGHEIVVIAKPDGVTRLGFQLP